MDYKRDEHGQTSSPTNLVCTPKRRKALLVGEIERECRALIQTVAAVHAKKRLVVGCRGTNGGAVKEAVLLIGSIVVLVVIFPFVWGAVYAMGGQ